MSVIRAMPLLAVAFSSTALAAEVGPFPIINTPSERIPVECYEGPGGTHHISKHYKLGDMINITCQTNGENVNRINSWAKTTDDCFVNNYYIDTNVIPEYMYVADFCDDVPERPNYGAGPIFDDYPWRGYCDGVDDYNYYQCQCTSFVAWRINDRLKINFHSTYKGRNWDFADNWDRLASLSGVLINNIPKPGAIAQTNWGDMESHHGPNTGNSWGDHGRVAWVAAVNSSAVTIEEYNMHRNDRPEHGNWEYRTLDAGQFMYIHFDAPISRPEFHLGWEGYNITRANDWVVDQNWNLGGLADQPTHW